MCVTIANLGLWSGCRLHISNSYSVGVFLFLHSAAAGPVNDVWSQMEKIVAEIDQS